MNALRTALITGATSGIGFATAHVLAKHGFRLILCGRRQDRLNALAEDLNAITPCTTCVFDVRHRNEVESALSNLPVAFQQIDVLINNAGNAHGLSTIQDGNIDDWDAMMDGNVKGLLYVTKAVLPTLMQQPAAHIINIGSIAGKEVYPNGNVYCASKFAVDALTKSMRIDLNAHGIKVTGIHPGLVETEFSLVRFKGNENRAKQTYQGIEALQADDIANLILYVLQCPPHVVLADIVVLPTAQASAAVLHRNGVK